MNYNFFKILRVNTYSEDIEIKHCRKLGEEIVNFTNDNDDLETKVFTKYQEIEVRSYDSTLKTKTKDLRKETVKEITQEEFEEMLLKAMNKEDERIQSAHREFEKYGDELNEMSLLATELRLQQVKEAEPAIVLDELAEEPKEK